MAEKCKACGRSPEQHKHSSKTQHEWSRIRCDGNYAAELVRKPVK